MPHWSHTLHVADVFHDDAIPFPVLRDTIVDRIRSAPFWDDDDDDLTEVVDELADTDTVHYFDQVWSAFYDWCDEHRVWVKTFTPGGHTS